MHDRSTVAVKRPALGRLAIGCLVVSALLAPDGSAQVTRGPYLQQGGESSITVHWRTTTASESTVIYGTEPGALTLSVSDPTPVTEHAVALSSLSPHTRYYYAISISGSVVAGGDLSTYFETSPPPGSVAATRIFVQGDSGTANQNAIDVYDAYLAKTGSVYTNLWLMLGDNAYTTGTDAQYQGAIFDVFPELLAQTPLWPTLGNHDGQSADSQTQTGPYYEIFQLPTAGEVGGEPSGTEAYYSFDYANVHFVVLDSHDSDRSVGGAMYLWLEDDLQSAVASGDSDWLIAYWHHPPYSKGSHDSDSEGRLVDMRTNFVPLLETYGVDLVLAGHSHSYERSYLIDGHYGLSGTFGPGHLVDGGDGDPAGSGAYEKATPGLGAHEGAVYAVAGSSGQTSGGTLNHPAMWVSLASLGSMILDVDGAQLTAAFIDEIGVVRDTFTLQKGAAPASGSIAGRVWHDVDGDGYRDDLEPDLSGIAVDLELANGVLQASTATAVDGSYAFAGLNAGAYRLQVRPGPRVLSAQDVGSDDARDSDVDRASGALELALVEGGTAAVDAGLVDAVALAGPIVDLSDVAVEPYPGLDGPTGTAESREGGDAYYTSGSRWIQTLATFDVTPSTVVSFEFRSQLPGVPSAIGFDDDGDPSTAIRLFDLSGGGALGTRAIPQSYEAAGGWQTYRIPVGQFFTASDAKLVLGVLSPDDLVSWSYVQDVPVAIDGMSTGTTYVDTHDAELREASPDANFDLGTGDPDPEFTVDLDDPGGSGLEAQVVMRFDSLVGGANWQIAPGTAIGAATLILDIDDTGSDLQLFELTTDFGAETSVTWNSVGGGIDPATQTTNLPTAIDGQGDQVLVDVTASVQGWVDGTPNRGWAVLSTGSGGVDFDASENSAPSDRPALVVTAAVPMTAETEIRNVTVPEPGQGLLLAAGCATLGALARHRRRR